MKNKDVGAGTLSQYCSAIKSLYKDEKIPLPLGYGDDMKEVFSGTHCFEIFMLYILTLNFISRH